MILMSTYAVIANLNYVDKGAFVHSMSDEQNIAAVSSLQGYNSP
jgi:hypothetical protein